MKLDFRALEALVSQAVDRAIEEHLPGHTSDSQISSEKWMEISLRAAAVGPIDQEIYSSVVAARQDEEFSFQRFLQRAEVSEIGSDGFARILRPPAELKVDLEPEARQRLIHIWTARVQKGTDPLWLLPHLLHVSGSEPARMLSAIVEDALAPDVFNLDRAETVLSVAGHYKDVMSEETRASYVQALSRFSTCKFFAQDHYKSGRYHQRNSIHEHVRSFLTSSNWLLPVCAAGGMGKTIFLRRLLTREWLQQNKLVARIDFDHVGHAHLAKAPWLILLPIARQLAHQTQRSSLKRFLDRGESWDRFLKKGNHLPGQSNPNDIPEGANIVPQSAWLGFAADMAASFADGLPPDRQLVVTLDTTEEPYLHGSKPFLALLTLFKLIREAGIETAPCDLRLILSGRYDLFACRNTDRQPRVIDLAENFADFRAQTLVIQGFTKDETREVLSTVYHLPHAADIADAVFVKSCDQSERALPFDVALWGRELRDHPDWTDKDIRDKDMDIEYLVRRILLRIPDHAVRWLVRYSALLRQITPEIVTDVVMPEVWQQLARDESEPQDDAANDGFPLVVHVRGGGMELQNAEVWQRLLDYASGPEEGWISPGNDGTYTLHPRVIQPIRRLVEKQEVWSKFHTVAQRWFEKLAGWPDGSRFAASNMGNALFHAFQLSSQDGISLWYACLQKLTPRDWRITTVLADVVLGDAGFEQGNEISIPLLDLQHQRRVPEFIEKQAAGMSVRGALQSYALEETLEGRIKSGHDAEPKVARWRHTSPPPDDFLHTAVALFHQFNLERTQPVSAGELILANPPSPSDEILLRLLLARLHDVQGNTVQAVRAYGELQTPPRGLTWSRMPLSKRQMMLIRLRFAIRHGAVTEDMVTELEKLPLPSSEPEERLTYCVSGARACLILAQPKRALRWLGPRPDDSEISPLLIVETELLRAECAITIRQMEIAEKALNSIQQTLSSLKVLSVPRWRLEAEWLRGLILSSRMECKEASEVWNNARGEADANQLREMDWKINEALARHKLLIEQAPADCRNHLSLMRSIASELANHATPVDRAERELAQAELELKAAQRNGLPFDDPSLAEYHTTLRRIARDTSIPVQAAIAVAILTIVSDEPSDRLISALSQIIPSSSRVRALKVLDHVGVGPERELTPNGKNLFARAFLDDSLGPQALGPSRLWVAHFYRLTGAPNQALKLVREVARSAANAGNPVLWHEATHAAYRLGHILRTDPPQTDLDSPLYWVLLLEQCERELASDSGVSPKHGPLLFEACAALYQQRFHESLSKTGFVPRVLEVTAKAASGQGRWNDAGKAWMEASSRWAELGQSVRSETCRKMAALEIGSGPTGRPSRDVRSPRRSLSAGETRQSPPTPTGSGQSGASTPLTAPQLNDFPYVSFDRSSWIISWHGSRHKRMLPPAVLKIAKEKSRRLQYQAALKLWSDPRVNVVPALRNTMTSIPELNSRFLGMVSAEDSGTALLPWEIEYPRGYEVLLRTNANVRINAGRTVYWIQQALRQWHRGEQLFLDGQIGPQTLRALADIGISGHRTLGEYVAAIRRRREHISNTTRLAKVCILNLTEEFEVSHAETADELESAYLVSSIDEEAFRAAPSFLRTNQSAFIHIRAALADRTESGSVTLGAMPGIRLDHLLNWLKNGRYDVGRWPVILLDLPMESLTIRDRRRAILQRNHFCGHLWQSGLAAAVIATSFHGKSPSRDRARMISTLIRRHASLAELVKALRDPNWGDMASATAAWGYHPEWPAYWPM